MDRGRQSQVGRRSRIAAAETDIGRQVSPADIPATEIKPRVGAMKCPGCGQPVLPDDNFCSQCKYELHKADLPADPAPAAAPRLTVMQVAPQEMRLLELSSQGQPVRELFLDREETLIGRIQGNFTYPDDLRMSDEHIKIVREYDGRVTTYTLHDLGSDVGTFLLLGQDYEWELFEAAEFIIGQQRMRFQQGPPSVGVPGKKYQIAVLGTQYEVVQTYPVRVDGTTIGRGDTHISFPDDMLVSALHARILMKDAKFFLRDNTSTNGVYYRVMQSDVLRDGDLILVGTRRFKFAPVKTIS
jgi:hypothetical protein